MHIFVKIKKETMSDNVKFISELERLLNQKQNDYGHFDNTSFVMAGILENYLSVYNNKEVKVPLKFFGIFMIFLILPEMNLLSVSNISAFSPGIFDW